MTKREIVRGSISVTVRSSFLGGITCPLSKISNGKKYFNFNIGDKLEKILNDTKLRGHLSGEQAVPS